MYKNTKRICFFAVLLLLWIVLGVVTFYRLLSGVAFPLWSSIFTLKVIAALLAPLLVLVLEWWLLWHFQKKWIGFLCVCAYGVFLVIWLLFCNALLFPIVSETTDIQNYLLFDASIHQTDEVNEVFPPSEMLENRHVKYKYRNDPSFFLNGENGYVALALQIPDTKAYTDEQNRIRSIEKLKAVTMAWDGYTEHLWDGYTVYSSVTNQDGVVQSFSWVLFSDSTKSIIYYHRFYGNGADSELETFINS